MTRALTFAISTATLSALAACSGEPSKKDAPTAASSASSSTATSPDSATSVNPRLLRRFQPLPESFDTDKGAAKSAKVDLGRKLFYETKLSKDGDLSCNSCHNLAAYGVDGAKTSVGHKKQVGRRNSPTVYNAAGGFAQFWDGRAHDVEEQAKGPILNPGEMAMPDAEVVVATLKAMPAYAIAFREAFPGEKEPITYDNVGRAIGAFEKGLVTPGRWDRFLRGDQSALTSKEKAGLKTFLDVGCMVCHTGPLLGGSMFERVGVVEPWPNQGDRGRGELTKNAAEGMMFKVPTLRNVAKTAPYFHDGSAATLGEAVRLMGRHQLGLDLNAHEIDSIVTWLDSLTGEIPTAYITRPGTP